MMRRKRGGREVATNWRHRKHPSEDCILLPQIAYFSSCPQRPEMGSLVRKQQLHNLPIEPPVEYASVGPVLRLRKMSNEHHLGIMASLKG